MFGVKITICFTTFVEEREGMLSRKILGMNLVMELF